jgi:hypothetical protein
LELSAKESHGRPEPGSLGVLRGAALLALLVGAVGSVGLTLHAGQRTGSPRLLLALMAIWVLSPFVALVVAAIVAKGWSVITRATLYSLMLVLTFGSLAVYGVFASGPLRAKPAFVFVMVPPASWLLSAMVISIAAIISRKLSRRS